MTEPIAVVNAVRMRSKRHTDGGDIEMYEASWRANVPLYCGTDSVGLPCRPHPPALRVSTNWQRSEHTLPHKSPSNLACFFCSDHTNRNSFEADSHHCSGELLLSLSTSLFQPIASTFEAVLALTGTNLLFLLLLLLLLPEIISISIIIISTVQSFA